MPTTLSRLRRIALDEAHHAGRAVSLNPDTAWVFHDATPRTGVSGEGVGP